MTTLELGNGTLDAVQPRRRLGLGTIIVIAIAVMGWILAGAGGVFGDYRRLNDRVTVLETEQRSNRESTEQRLERIEHSIERMDEKLDRALTRASGGRE